MPSVLSKPEDSPKIPRPTSRFSTFLAAYDKFNEFREEGDKVVSSKDYLAALKLFAEALDIANSFPDPKQIEQEIKSRFNPLAAKSVIKELPGVIASVEGMIASCFMKLDLGNETQHLILVRRLLDSSLAKDPNWPNTHLYFVEYLMKIDPSCGQAQAYLNRLLHTNKNTVVCHQAALQLLRLYEENSQVLSLGRSGLDLINLKSNPRDPETCRLLGDFYLLQSCYPEAIAKFKAAISLISGIVGREITSILYFNLGIALSRGDNPDRNLDAALLNFMKAREFGNSSAAHAIATIYDQGPTPEKALPFYIEAMSQENPNAINAKYNYAPIYI